MLLCVGNRREKVTLKVSFGFQKLQSLSSARNFSFIYYHTASEKVAKIAVINNCSEYIVAKTITEWLMKQKNMDRMTELPYKLYIVM